jgi:site-specific recombinase XerD
MRKRIKRSTATARMTKRGWIEHDVTAVWPNGEWTRERQMCPRQSIKAAQEWARERLNALLDMGPPSTRQERAAAPLFEVFWERWIREHDEARRHKPSTIRTKRVILKSHLAIFNGRRIDTITVADVAALQAKMAEGGSSPKTTNNVLSVLGKLLKTAEKWGVIAKAPAVELVRAERRPMPYFSIAVYDRLVHGARLAGKQSRALVLLAGDAGLRLGEILALDWKHVDLERGLIAVQQSENAGNVTGTKGRDWRVVAMTVELRAALDDLSHRTGRVLKGRTKNGGIERKTAAALVKAAEKAAGLPETGRIHVLRHTYASSLAEAGQSLYHLQMALGHESHKTTEGYAKLSGVIMKQLASVIDARRQSPVRGDREETIQTLQIEGRKD